MYFLNKCSDRQCRNAAHGTENCSAQVVHDALLRSMESVPLLSNMTSEPQPADAAVGCSCNCAFRLLLLDRILTHVESSLVKSAHKQPPFKMSYAVRTFDALRLMKARDFKR